MSEKIPFARPGDHSGVWDGVYVDRITDYGFAEGKPRVGVIMVHATPEQRKKNREALRAALQCAMNRHYGVDDILIKRIWFDGEENQQENATPDATSQE